MAVVLSKYTNHATQITNPRVSSMTEAVVAAKVPRSFKSITYANNDKYPTSTNNSEFISAPKLPSTYICIYKFSITDTLTKGSTNSEPLFLARAFRPPIKTVLSVTHQQSFAKSVSVCHPPLEALCKSTPTHTFTLYPHHQQFKDLELLDGI